MDRLFIADSIRTIFYAIVADELVGLRTAKDTRYSLDGLTIGVNTNYSCDLTLDISNSKNIFVSVGSSRTRIQKQGFDLLCDLIYDIRDQLDILIPRNIRMAFGTLDESVRAVLATTTIRRSAGRKVNLALEVHPNFQYGIYIEDMHGGILTVIHEFD